MDDIAYLVSVQPVLVSLILYFVVIALALCILDFFLSAFCPWWSSPHGYHVKKKGSKNQNETK